MSAFLETIDFNNQAIHNLMPRLKPNFSKPSGCIKLGVLCALYMTEAEILVVNTT